MEHNLISVVVPVYNVARYLEEFLESLVKQTYKNLQIILVDDGSTDASGVICDRYAKKDNRITVIHQENAGAGAAKNTGLAVVKGDYLSIVDSDDYLELNYYERLLQVMTDFGADVCQCLFDYVFQDSSFSHEYMFRKDKKLRVISSKRFLREALADWKYNIFCNKLFKSSLLEDIKFPVGSKIDDEFFTYKLICNSKRIVNLSEVLYHYRQRKSSVMRDSQKMELTLNRIKCFDERYQYISKKYPRLRKEYYHHFADYINTIYHFGDEYSNNQFIIKTLNKYPQKQLTILDKIHNRLFMIGYKRFIFTYNGQKYFK